jgi:drug/metabolite transporter (DMT)-like permease
MWIQAAISGYFFSGLTKVVDKILLSETIPNPRVYVFYAGILSAPIFFLVPYVDRGVSFGITVISLAAGICFLASLYFFYAALQLYDASRIVPLYAAATPFAALLFSGEYFRGKEILALVCLVAGGALLSFRVHSNTRFETMLILYAMGAAFLMGASLSATKYIFSSTSFINGFVLTRIGIFTGACLLFLIPAFRRDILSAKRPRMKSGALFVANKIMGAVGAFLVAVAISGGPVTLVQALGSFEYLFVFLLTWALSLAAPHVLKEEITSKELSIKIGGAALLSAALILLFL